MIKQIEIYDIKENRWSDVVLKNQYNLWNGVEACSSVQIGAGRILIFGGSDVNIEDTMNTFILDTSNNDMKKISNLTKPQVFIHAPFKHVN